MNSEPPLESQILAVADVYDALTSDRPYRGAMDTEEALSVLRDISGTQLAPDIVDTFIDERIYGIDHKKDPMSDLEVLTAEL